MSNSARETAGMGIVGGDPEPRAVTILRQRRLRLGAQPADIANADGRWGVIDVEALERMSKWSARDMSRYLSALQSLEAQARGSL